MDEARIEQDWRDLVENAVVAATFSDQGEAERWRDGLRARARRLGRRIRTGPGPSGSTWWAVLVDWEQVVPRHVQIAKLRDGFAWWALHDPGRPPL